MSKSKNAPVEIQEYADSRGVKLDVSSPGVIRGVKVLGLESKNGRVYPKETIARAAALYEGAKVNVDHADNPGQRRSYSNRIGQIRNLRVGQGDTGLFADFHYNPKHALAEQLAWDADNASENVGFSHNVMARVTKRDGQAIVEEITRVVSVDLVADPATTRGLFESNGNLVTDLEDENMSDKQITLALLEAEHGDLVKAIREKALAEHSASAEAKARDAEFDKLKEELDLLKAEKALVATKTKVEKMIEDAKLPKEVLSDLFMVNMLEAKDDERRKALIEDRKALVEAAKGKTPKSKEQNTTEGSTAATTSVDEWVSAVTS